MKKVLIIIGLLILGYVLFFIAEGGTKNLVSPQNANVFNKKPAAVATPMPTPKNFKFDSSTDLNSELEKVNPKVTDKDFE